jgi:Fe-Mn family superoxide dismutase
MKHQLPPLPYAMDALEPTISRETLEYHHGKHHNAYVTRLNELIPGTQFESSTLEEIVKNSEGAIFNQAAQVWNHTFYWNCLSPTETSLDGPLLDAINAQFGSVEAFMTQFSDKAMTQFGSGWAWLVKNSDGTLSLEQTSNADTPLRTGATPLLTCDVWEHAYYVDYRNARADYVKAFWKLVNWDFVKENFLA